jgi:hypothetical protein
MELYNVPDRTWVLIQEDATIPPAAPGIPKGDIIYFDHIDGMYSYCKNRYGEIVHMAAWTEVTPLTFTIGSVLTI